MKALVFLVIGSILVYLAITGKADRTIKGLFGA